MRRRSTTRAACCRLTLSHLRIVFLATLASTLVAVGLGIFVTRPVGAEFLPLSRSLVNIGQTFPPVAVLALAVPLVGFGEKPTFIALFLYGLLPIFENTLERPDAGAAAGARSGQRHGHERRASGCSAWNCRWPCR